MPDNEKLLENIRILTSNVTDEFAANNIRGGAADALGAVPSDEAANALITAAKNDPAWNVRGRALTALGALAKDHADLAIDPQVFLDALNDAKSYPVECAAKVLGRLHCMDALAPLLGIIDRYEDGKDFSAASAAIDALGAFGDGAVPAITEKLTDSPKRGYFLRALAATGSLAAFDTLKDALADTALAGYEKVNIVRGLEKIGTPEAIDTLTAALDDEADPAVVKALTASLEKLGVPEEQLADKRNAAERRSMETLLTGLKALKPGMTEDEADALVGPGNFQMGPNVVHNTKYGTFQVLVNDAGKVFGTQHVDSVINALEAKLAEMPAAEEAPAKETPEEEPKPEDAATEPALETEAETPVEEPVTEAVPDAEAPAEEPAAEEAKSEDAAAEPAPEPVPEAPAETKPAEPVKTAPEKKNNTKKILIAILALCLAGAGIFYTISANHKKNYEQAAEYYAAGQYEEAAALYEKLGSYKDAADLHAKTISWIEAEELKAKAGTDAAAWDKAAKAYEAIDDEKAQDQAAACRRANKYYTAADLMNAQDWEAAKELLGPLVAGNYKEAKTMMTACNTHITFNEAEALYAEGKFYDAWKLYRSIQDTDYDDLPDLYERADMCIQAPPATGVVYRNPAYPNNAVQLSIDNSGYKNSFVKLYIGDDLVASVFIAEDATATFWLPAGTYRMNKGYGDTWFGTEDLFGDEGRYWKCKFGGSETFTLEAGYGYTISSGTGGTGITNSSTGRDDL